MELNKTLSEVQKKPFMPGEQGFDYSVISPKSRNIVLQNTNEIKSLMRRTAQDIITIGEKLIEAKENLGHGHFETWLRAEFNWGQWTARKFMQVTRKFKTVNFTDLSINASALYLLSAPSTPEEVWQEALKLAGQGETITHAKVKVIASRYEKSTNSEVTKSLTIDIPAQNEEWKGSTRANPLPASQIEEAESVAVVKQSEDKLPGKRIAAPAHCQLSNHSHNMTLITNSSNYPLKNQLKIDMQSLIEIGHLVCVTDRQQAHKWFGEVTEVKEVTATDLKVVIEISLQPVKD